MSARKQGGRAGLCKLATESKKENTKRSAHFYVKTMERTIEHGAEYVARREGERGVGGREEREEREGKCSAR